MHLKSANEHTTSATPLTTFVDSDSGFLTRSQNEIDNSRNVYIPVRLPCGIQVMCRLSVLLQCPQVLQDLHTDVYVPCARMRWTPSLTCICRQGCLELLPLSVHNLIHRTRIWVNLYYRMGNLQHLKLLNHTTTHHHEGWLLWAKDRPDKRLGIEVYDCWDYRRMRLHWNGCGLLLHEYCHLIHQFALRDGLNNPVIPKAYALAQLSGLYDNVRRRDWAGQDEDFDLAYAMVDYKEFFAELSVAYWSQGYEELDQCDENRIMECSPPFLEPTVIERIQASRQVSSPHEDGRRLLTSGRESVPNGPIVMFSPFLGHRKLPHSNKFYPFTRGQLRRYDPASYETIRSLWDEIAQWEDGDDKTPCCKTNGCWTSPFARKQVFADTIDL